MRSQPLVCLATASLILLLTLPARAQVDETSRQLTQGPPTNQLSSQRRIALVIGNGAYQYTGRLVNPPNDASLVTVTLRSLGFDVKSGTNLSQREMKQKIREFGLSLRSNGGVGLFYFAGHGVQAKGHNYLVPVDADIQTEADIEDAAVDINYVLSLMDDAQNALNIVILDACRNNPFARSFRSAEAGLAQVKAPTGTLIAYATAPDSIAADGSGANSPYTEELIKQMKSSGVLVETMFRRVTEQVSARTSGKQEPWFSANVKGDFYLNSSGARKSQSDPPVSNVDPTAIELSYWDSIKNSTSLDDFKSYLENYPEGRFATLAKTRIRDIEVKPASFDPPGTSNWMSSEDYQKEFMRQKALGNFAPVAQGRNYHGENQYRATFRPIPAGVIAWDCRHSIRKDLLDAYNKKLLSEGYTQIWLQVFTDASGMERYQATWVKYK